MSYLNNFHDFLKIKIIAKVKYAGILIFVVDTKLFDWTDKHLKNFNIE